MALTFQVFHYVFSQFRYLFFLLNPYPIPSIVFFSQIKSHRGARGLQHRPSACPTASNYTVLCERSENLSLLTAAVDGSKGCKDWWPTRGGDTGLRLLAACRR